MPRHAGDARIRADRIDILIDLKGHTDGATPGVLAGPALEIGSACGSGLLFLCDGQEVSAHFARAERGACADLLLRGRLS